MKNRRFLFGVSALAFGCVAPIFAQAQQATQTTAAAPASDTLEEVIVTAERVTADVQKTGVSVAVRSGDDMAREGKDDLAQMLEDVPGVTPVLAGAGAAAPNDNPGGNFIIRGVAPAQEPPGDTAVASTALYTDGVYGGIGNDYDVDRLEVLRGPQGTLYGRSATSGVISTYTRDPVLGAWNGYANVEYGSYDLQHAQAAVNIPLGDTLAVRVAANDLYQNGFLGGNTGGSHGVTEGRIKLLYQPTANFSVLLGWAIQADNYDTGGPSGSLSAPNTIAITPSSAFDPVTDVYHQYWGKLNWDLGFATLTYMPALRTFSSDSPSLLNFAGPTPTAGFIQDETNNYSLDQIHTEELRLASKPGSGLSWIVGAWFYERLYDYDYATIWEPSGGYSHGQDTIKQTTNAAGFGEATYPILDTLRLTAGLRYDYTRIDSQNSTYTQNLNQGLCGDGATGGGCYQREPTFSLPNNIFAFTLPAGSGIRSQDNVTFKVRLEDDVTPSNMVYGMVSSGFLPGDVAISNTQLPSGAVGVEAFQYAPEQLISYEIGSKNRFFGNKVQINGDVYYYDYSGYQTDINLGIGPSPNLVLTSVPARMAGAEIETLWQLTANDRLSLSAGYVDARYVDKSAFFATYVVQNTIPGVAPLTLQGKYDHRFNLPDGSSLNLGADAFFLSSQDETALSVAFIQAGGEPFVHETGEVVGNARVTWTSSNSKYSVTGYVRNLANNVYKQAATYNGDFGGNLFTSVDPSAPRVIGVVLHATF